MMKRVLTIAAITIYTVAGAQTIPNAGFENWVNQTNYEELTGWGASNIYSPQTVIKSTNAHSGTYAVKIETILGDPDGDGINDTIGGNIFVGSYNAVTGDGIDGVPFTARPDSLVFWCRYAPQGGDNFMIASYLYKWNNANSTRDVIADGVYSTSAAMANYTRIAIPFNYQSTGTPDTISITIASHTLGMGSTTPGTALWVDDLSLVTNPATAGIAAKTEKPVIQLYPNPASESLNLVVSKDAIVEIYNALGMHVETIKASVSKTTTLSTARYDNGVYLVKTDSGHMQRFVVKH